MCVLVKPRPHLCAFLVVVIGQLEVSDTLPARVGSVDVWTKWMTKGLLPSEYYIKD